MTRNSNFVHSSIRLPKRFRNSTIFQTLPLLDLPEAFLKRFLEISPTEIFFNLRSSSPILLKKSYLVKRIIVGDHLVVFQDGLELRCDLYVNGRVIHIRDIRRTLKTISVRHELRIGNANLPKNLLFSKLPRLNHNTLILLCNQIPWDCLRHLLTPNVKNVRVVRWSNEVPNLADFFISFIYAERIEITIYADPLLKTVDFPCPLPLLTRWFSYRRVPLREFYFLFGKHVIGFDQGRFKYSKKWGKDPSNHNIYCYLPIEDPLVKDKDDYSFIEWSTMFT